MRDDDQGGSVSDTGRDEGVAELRSALSGQLIAPGEPAWESARLAWNRAVDQHPVAVVTPADVDDVRRILAAARAAGWGVTVQPHGHGAGGALSGCLLVRPALLDDLEIDVAARTARAGAGVDWGRVLTALAGTGLVALAGSNPAVSVVGYTLAGGHSAFSRAFGLAANAVTAIEMVLPDGRAVRTDADHDPELFWAVRGGGGLFGVVTAVEFRLFPVPASSGMLYGGKLTYSADAAAAVLGALARVVPTLPDEVTVSGMLMNLPDLPTVPEPLRGTTVCSIDVVSLLDAEVTETLIGPLRGAATALADTVASFGIDDLPSVAAEPVDPVGALDHGLLLETLTADVVDRLLTAFTAATPHGLSLVQVRPLGGAIAAPGRDTGVAGAVTAAALVGMSALVPGPVEPDHPATAAIATMVDGMKSDTATGLVATFLSDGQDLAAAYGAPAIARLRRTASHVDPDGVMHGTRPLPSPL